MCLLPRRPVGNIRASTADCMDIGPETKSVNDQVPVWLERLQLRRQNRSHVKFALLKHAMQIIFLMAILKVIPRLIWLVSLKIYMKLPLFLMMVYFGCPLTKHCLPPLHRESIPLWHLYRHCRFWPTINISSGPSTALATGPVLDLSG